MGPEKIPFEWMGLQLLEPMAIALNLCMAALSLFYAFKLKNQEGYEKAWGYFFLTFGLASMFSAVGHGMYNYWGIPGKMPGWFTSLLAIYFLEQAQLSWGQPPQWLKKVSSAKLILLAVGMAFAPSFLWVVAQTITGLVPGLILFGVRYRHVHPGARYFRQAFWVLLPALILYGLGIDPHRWFNRDDASHVLMLLTLYLSYKGARS